MKGEVIIREAKPHGHGAYIIVPKAWLGWMVRCEVVRKGEAIRKLKEVEKK